MIRFRLYLDKDKETEWLNITDHFVKYTTDNTKKASRPGNSGSWLFVRR